MSTFCLHLSEDQLISYASFTLTGLTGIFRSLYYCSIPLVSLVYILSTKVDKKISLNLS